LAGECRPRGVWIQKSWTAAGGGRRAARDFGEPETGTSHHAEMNVNLNYVLSVLWFILWLAALVDCLKGNSPNKLVWVVVIILLPFLGSILYFAIGKSRV
jgi:hypothetical protein